MCQVQAEVLIATEWFCHVFFCLKNDMFQIRIASSTCFAEAKDM